MLFCRLLLIALLLPAAGFYGCARGPLEQPPLTRLEQAHGAAVQKVAFSSDGTRLASAGYDARVRVWSVPDGRLQQVFTGHRWSIPGLAWGEGGLLVSGGGDGRIMVWDTVSGQVAGQLKMPSAVVDLKRLPGGKLVASAHKDGRLLLHRLPRLEREGEFRFEDRVRALAAAPDGASIAVALAGPKVALLDLASGETLFLPAPPREVSAMAFSPDGRHLAGAGWYELMVWDLAREGMEVRKAPHWGKVPALAYTPDGALLATIGRWTDTRIVLSDAAGGNAVRHLQRHAWCGADLAISPAGRYLASGSDDQSVRIYDLERSWPPTAWE